MANGYNVTKATREFCPSGTEGSRGAQFRHLATHFRRINSPSKPSHSLLGDAIDRQTGRVFTDPYSCHSPGLSDRTATWEHTACKQAILMFRGRLALGITKFLETRAAAKRRPWFRLMDSRIWKSQPATNCGTYRVQTERV